MAMYFIAEFLEYIYEGELQNPKSRFSLLNNLVITGGKPSTVSRMLQNMLKMNNCYQIIGNVFGNTKNGSNVRMVKVNIFGEDD